MNKKEIIWKYEIGQRIINYNENGNIKRDLTIIKKELRNDKNKCKRKWYKYICGKCNWNQGWIEEYALNKGNGCSCCAGKTVVQGINDIATTAPWMVKYFQGGYDEAKLYTKTGSGNPNNRYDKINPICPDCGRVKSKPMTINNLSKYKTINCSCSDNISYGEKLMFLVLEQLDVQFQTQLSKTTFKWCENYRYDFYFELNSEGYVIETHGKQHYEDAWDKLEKNQENDRLKKVLALQNGIKEENYIVIDCRKSELEWIKNNILTSNLAKIFDLSNIDWLKAEEFALSNIVKVACDLWNNGIHSTTKIARIMKLHKGTIVNYLKKGHELEITEYDTIISIENNNKNNGARLKTMSSKSIISVDKGCIFESSKECSNKSEEVFSVKLTPVGIARVCRGERPHYKGLKFKFTQDLTEEEIKQIQENAKLSQAI